MLAPRSFTSDRSARGGLTRAAGGHPGGGACVPPSWPLSPPLRSGHPIAGVGPVVAM